MMGSRHSGGRLWVALAFSAVLLVRILAVAQEPARSTAAPQASAADRTYSSPGVRVPQNSTPDTVAKDGGEASDSDGTAQLKNSPSVKWLAHLLRVRTTTAYQLCIALNFAAMVTVIVWFLGPRLPVWLRNRAQAIRQSLDDAGKASIEAQQRLAAIEARMLKLESEITAMQTVADQESMAEEERFRASAEDDKRKIAAIAEQQILAAVTRAKRDFKLYAAELMVTLAATRIKVDAATEEEILHSFIYELGNKGSN